LLLEEVKAIGKGGSQVPSFDQPVCPLEQTQNVQTIVKTSARGFAAFSNAAP